MYLLGRSALNSARFRLQRLREPRYLLPILAVAGYVWLALGMPGLRSDVPGVDTRALEEAAGGALQMALIVGLASSWLTAARSPTPPFSEAEVQWLFPSPLSRRTLIGYALLRPQPSLLLVACGFALLGLAGGGMHAIQYGLGIYLLFNLFAFNGILASMVSARILRSTISPLLTRLPGLLLCAYVALALALAYPSLGPSPGAGSVMRWVTQWLDAPPAGWMLWPWRTAALLPFTASAEAFAARALVVAGLVAFCALGALAFDAPFEEAALARAEAHTRRLTAFRRGKGALADLSRVREARPFLLPIAPDGPAWRAVLWKNVVAFFRMLSLRQAFIALAFLAMPALGLLADPQARPWATCMLLVVDLSFLLMLGPTWFGQGVRADLQYIDVWKAGPLAGKDVVRGGTYASSMVIGAVAAAAGAVGLLVDPGAPLAASGTRTSALCASALVVFMGLIPLSVASDGLLSVLAPAWTLPDRGQTGLENMGRELISLFARTMLVGVAALPSLGVGLAVGLVLHPSSGEHALFAGPVVVLVGCVATTELLCGWAGARFDRMDPTSDALA